MGITMTTVSTTDGRQLEVGHTELGGRPVVVVHNGTPGGLAEWPWMAELTDAAGLTLVQSNRPGYGASTARPGRTVASIPEDTTAVLDHLGVGAFTSLGISGGGPHALADGALLGDRCLGVVDVCGLAPPDLPGLDLTAGMKDDNQVPFRAAGARDMSTLQEYADGQAAMLSLVTPELLVEFAPAAFPAVDAAVMSGPQGPAFAEFFASMMSAAFTSGTAGLVDDMLALSQPWGFDLGDVEVPVTIWHGELDENVPVSHGRAIEAAVPSATARYRPEHGHVSILLELPAIVDDVAALARR